MKTKTRAHRKLLEKDVEQYLCRQVEKLGGKAYKFSSPANRAVPDRICCFPHGQIVFVECKAPGKKATPLQLKVLTFLRQLRFNVAIVDTKERVDIVINMVKEDQKNAENSDN